MDKRLSFQAKVRPWAAKGATLGGQRRRPGPAEAAPVPGRSGGRVSVRWGYRGCLWDFWWRCRARPGWRPSRWACSP